ncbi:MAG: DMT family transporter [Mariniblastus sp.]
MSHPSHVLPNGSTITQSNATSRPPGNLADISLLIVAVIWGVNMAVMKLALNEVDPFMFNAFRLPLSAVVLGVFSWMELKRNKRVVGGPSRQSNSDKLSSEDSLSTFEQKAKSMSTTQKWISIAAFSCFAGGLYQILFAIGMARTTAGNTALIMSSMPMWTAVLSFFLLREKLKLAWFGLIITFLGTVVVTLQGGKFSMGSENFVGNLLVLSSALAWAMGAVISRPLLTFVSPIRLAFYATVGTFPIHFAMPFFLSTTPVEAMGNSFVVASVLYSGIFSTGLAYAMWNFGVLKLGASQAAVYQNLVPLVALIAAWVSPLREVLTPMQFLGGVMIIFGLFVTRRLRPNR